MAAAILRQRFEEMGLASEIRIRSAGVYAETGDFASPLAVAKLAEHGISLEDHRSQPMTPALLQEADIVLVMEEAHRRSAFYLQPQHLGKVYLLSELTGKHDDIADPYGGSAASYERTIAVLEQMIDAGMPKLLQLLKINVPAERD
jgi:protein-tyrosine-phosphatase